jgi:hypothetical protein
VMVTSLTGGPPEAALGGGDSLQAARAIRHMTARRMRAF